MPLLHDVFDNSRRTYPQRVAFDSDDRQWTFEEFGYRIEHLAGALESLGIRQGDRVAILSTNQPDYIAYHYATSRLGALLLVLNFRHTAGELLWALNDAQASALIIDPAMQHQLEEIISKCGSLRFTIGLGTAEGTTYLTDELAAQGLSLRSRPVIHEKDPVLLIYTSGTTGRPKGALQTHEGSTMIDELTAEALEISQEDVYLAFMPYFHQAGLIRSRATMIRGGMNLVIGKLDPETLVNNIIEKRVSLTMLVPPYDTLLTRIADDRGLNFPSLRFIIGAGGAGPLHAEAMRVFCEKFNCRYMGVYGQTEVTGPATIIYDNEYFAKPFSCGRPMRGIEFEIWDTENHPLPVGEVGEIMVRGKNCVPGYWNNKEATSLLYTGEWLHTGDLARMDDEGFVYFIDRKKELVKTGGENVYPREVEDVLKQHPAVADVVVIGLPDPGKWGEIVTAVIVLKGGETLNLDEVKTFCRNKIGGYKIPKVIKIVDEIPRNASGKPLKLDLRTRFSEKTP